MNTDCTHERIRGTETRCYTSGARGAHLTSGGENRRAHGGIAYHEVCLDCGAGREVVATGRHVEQGAWYRPERRFVGRTGSGKGLWVYLTADGVVHRARSAREDRGRWVEDEWSRPRVPAAALETLGAATGRVLRTEVSR